MVETGHIDQERFAVMISHSDIPRTLAVERSMAAMPGAAWELIADITCMGDRSPKTTSAEWLGPSNGPAPSALQGYEPDGPEEMEIGFRRHGMRARKTLCV